MKPTKKEIMEYEKIAKLLSHTIEEAVRQTLVGVAELAMTQMDKIEPGKSLDYHDGYGDALIDLMNAVKDKFVDDEPTV